MQTTEDMPPISEGEATGDRLVMRNRSTSAARCAVLETTELLEMVLLALPPRDTIVSMRVCKAWNKCIHHSPSMAQHLFLQSKGLRIRQLLWRHHDTTTGRCSKHSVATLDLAETYSDKVVRSVPGQANLVTALLTPARLCPLMAIHYAQPARVRMSGIPEERIRLARKKPGMWEFMLLCDPPCESAEVIASLRHSYHPELEIHLARRIANPAGLRLSDAESGLRMTKGCVTALFPEAWGDDIEFEPTDSHL